MIVPKNAARENDSTTPKVAPARPAIASRRTVHLPPPPTSAARNKAASIPLQAP